MKNLIFLVLISAVAIGGFGLYRGWFVVSSTHDTSAPGGADKTHVTVTVDKDKIHEDEAKVKAKAQDAAEKGKEKAAEVIGNR